MNTTAFDLGLTDFELDIRMTPRGFWYQIIFRLSYTNKNHSMEGVAASPTQAHEQAMSYMAYVMREAMPTK